MRRHGMLRCFPMGSLHRREIQSAELSQSCTCIHTWPVTASSSRASHVPLFSFLEHLQHRLPTPSQARAQLLEQKRLWYTSENPMLSKDAPVVLLQMCVLCTLRSHTSKHCTISCLGSFQPTQKAWFLGKEISSYPISIQHSLH